MGAFGDRIRQFREASIPPTEADFALARQVLGEGPLLDLFLRQTPRDTRHAAGTARWLIKRNYDDPLLLTAALLHDIGKGDQRRRDRVAWVVVQRFGLGAAASDSMSRFAMRRAMARTADHAAEGARMVAIAGGPERVVDLTARHHSGPGADAMLGLLQAADAAS